MTLCDSCDKEITGKGYELGLVFIAEDNDKATDENDSEPTFCNVECANCWLGHNFQSFIRGVASSV